MRRDLKGSRVEAETLNALSQRGHGKQRYGYQARSRATACRTSSRHRPERASPQRSLPRRAASDSRIRWLLPRLIYAPPQRRSPTGLRPARRWLADLRLTDQVTLDVAMGARWETEGDWRDDPDKPAVLIGTTDVSSRRRWCGRSTSAGRSPRSTSPWSPTARTGSSTSRNSARKRPRRRQLAGLAARIGTAEPFGLSSPVRPRPRSRSQFKF